MNLSLLLIGTILLRTSIDFIKILNVESKIFNLQLLVYFVQFKKKISALLPSIRIWNQQSLEVDMKTEQLTHRSLSMSTTTTLLTSNILEKESVKFHHGFYLLSLCVFINLKYLDVLGIFFCFVHFVQIIKVISGFINIFLFMNFWIHL